MAPKLESLTDKLKTSLETRSISAEFDVHRCLQELLTDVGLTAADCGGKLTFYGRDPIVPSSFKFGAMSAVCLAAKSVAIAALWKDQTGVGQDIHVDVRKALRRFSGFLGQWETVNGRGPLLLARDNPFLELPLFRRTRDGRHEVALIIYPGRWAFNLALTESSTLQNFAVVPKSSDFSGPCMHTRNIDPASSRQYRDPSSDFRLRAAP